jgi:hypothetical protein
VQYARKTAIIARTPLERKRQWRNKIMSASLAVSNHCPKFMFRTHFPVVINTTVKESFRWLQPYLLIDVTLLWAAAPSGSRAPLAQLKGETIESQVRWQQGEAKRGNRDHVFFSASYY